MQYREDWPDLEGAEGQYTFDKLTELYDALAACKKRLIVEIWAVTFSMSDPGAAVPAYLLNDAKYDGGVARTSVGYIAKMWEAPVMDRLLALYGALAARFDTAPYFEAIVFSETATSKVGDTYSPSAWVSQLKRAISTIRSNWPHTNVVFYNNFIQGASESQLADVYAALRTSDAATGAPDVLPPPHAVRGEMIYRGELAGGADLRGQIPAMFAVQTPELGGKEGAFSPQELADYIIKDVGGAHDVDRVYKVEQFKGTHGLGHVRLATESDVAPEASHPFWATGFADIAIVHNGQITNYYKMRRRLEKRGYQFNTDNDSELIAVYLADKLAQGTPLEEGLAQSIEDMDGTFSFLISTRDEIGFAKDRLAAKPMVMVEDEDIVAIASEEVSLNRLFPGRSLVTTEPAPGTFRTWRRSI